MKKPIFYFIKYCLSLAYGLSPTLGDRLAFTLFTRPLFQVQKQSELQYLGEMSNTWKKFERKNIKVYQGGFGKKVILFVHGWRGYAGNFCELMTLFPEHEYSLIAFDAPAHNASTGNSTNVFQIIRLCGLLIEKYKPDFVIGHSMGSAVAVSALANIEYNKVEKLILLSCPNSFEYLVESFGRNFSLKDAQLESFKSKVQFELQKSFEEAKIEHLITNVSVSKILLVHDKFDRVLPFENAQAIYQAGKGMVELQTIENVGHYKMLKDSNVLQSIIKYINEK